MSGETDLKKLLQGMKPNRNQGEFVFCTADTLQSATAMGPLCIFQEQEAITVILAKEKADEASLPYSTTFSWITFTVHSSLEAVGLTAAVSKALAEANISCNVVAAYYHDHIFVPVKDADKAMDALIALSREEAG